jgi:hypothetical protein
MAKALIMLNLLKESLYSIIHHLNIRHHTASVPDRLTLFSDCSPTLHCDELRSSDDQLWVDMLKKGRLELVTEIGVLVRLLQCR